MARTVRDTNLETRSARLRLRIRAEPYWRGLEKGFFLGYRRRASGGTWLARRRRTNGGYAEHRISTTDDFVSSPSSRRRSARHHARAAFCACP
jgi:hypothetical protein